jgi:hypothetical protein
MTLQKLTLVRFAAAAIAFSLFVPEVASAQARDGSTVRATIYGFIPNVSGETAFPTPLGNTFDLNGETLLNNTDLALMGLFEVQKGRLGAFTDIMYFNLGTSKSATREVAVPGAPVLLPIRADAQVDIKAWIVMAAANVRAVSGRSVTLDFFGGARRLEAEATLDYTFTSPIGPGPQGSAGATNGNWDGIGGVKGRLTLGRLTVPFYADAGAGHSDLTVQAMAGVTYAFRHIELGAVYRYLDYDMKSDGRMLDAITFSGPMTGVTFKW